MTDSLIVAEFFGKRHTNVIRDIEMLDCSREFGELNFERTSYKTEQNKKQPMYTMTFDGFMFLAMGYRGKKAAQLKEKYIQAFNEMAKTIQYRLSLKSDFPLLTESVRMIHDEPRSYHFSNECNLINQVALGMTARAFRKAHKLGDVDSIRPYLSQQQVELINILQKVDIGLLLSTPDYEQRKKILEKYKEKYEKEQKQALVEKLPNARVLETTTA